MKKNIIKISIILLISIFSFLIIDIKTNDIKEEIIVSNYINNSKYRKYNTGVLEVPKIGIKNSIKKAMNDYSNLDDGLVYYKALDTNNRIIIFGHSGMGKGVYFNRLDELQKGDIAYIYHDNLIIKYVLRNTTKVDYRDTSILKEKLNKKELLLVTCDKNNKNLRLVLYFVSKSAQNIEK